MSVLIIVVAALALWLLARSLLGYWKFRQMELAIAGPKSLPFLGNLLDVLGRDASDRLQVMMSLWGQRWTELSRMSLPGQLFVVVTDPDHVAVVLKDPRFKEKPDLFYGFLRLLSGDGLVTANGSYWKAHRTGIQPAFHADVLERFVPVFLEEAEGFVSRVRPYREEDVTANLQRALARSSLRTIMASEVLPHEEALIEDIIANLSHALKDVNDRTFKPWLWPDFIFNMTEMGRRVRDFDRVSTEFGTSVLKRIRASLSQKTERSQRKTFAEIMVESETNGQPTFTDEEILNEGRTIFGASVETSVTILGCILKTLSVRQDVQDRVLHELHDVLSDRIPSAADMNRLTYMECVIKETLRLLPSIPIVARMVKEETELDGKTLPAGTMLLINIVGMHRDPRHFADPLRFDPDRFRPDVARHPFSYLPFSGGQRNCIGQRYAMLAVKTLLATVLRAFSVQQVDDGLTDPATFPINFHMSLKLVGGVNVRFVPRTAL